MPLPAVLRWADGRLTVEVRDSAPAAPAPVDRYRSVEVVLGHAAHPRLLVHWSFSCDVGTVGLSGLTFERPAGPGGYDPVERGEGVGTVVVNTGIQYLRTLYPGPDAPFTTYVDGKTGLAWAAPDSAAAQRDVDGRARFWLGFGFAVGGEVPGQPATRQPHAPMEPMRAPLWRLTVQPGGRLFRRDSPRGSRPLWLPLSAFEPGARPRRAA